MEKVRERVLSDKNIFLSIFLLDSYIQNKDLLSSKEWTELRILKDVFNLPKINKTINKVRMRLEKLLDDESDYFHVMVFFKPKKFKDNQTFFRPLHTASLIDQIAMIALLQVLVYDIDKISGKLIPSELSRLLPSNFYGNRISFDGNKLFKPWQDQYQEYTTKANDMLYNYGETLEYKYEVSLDLENFFPSINPQILYNFVTDQLPLKLATEDNSVIRIILKKLLIFKLCELNAKETKWYLNETGNSTRNVCYAKGLPQGLPHTYFMANIFMLKVKEKYAEIFPGQMLFFVDDSVIYTNGARGSIESDSFSIDIGNLNESINREEKQILKTSHIAGVTIFPRDYCYGDKDYGVKVHGSDSKSVFSHITNAKRSSGEMYLQSLSRETSNLGHDIFTAFSDAEVRMTLGRTKVLLEAVLKELKNISDEPSQKAYRDKLLRYKKFFAYRKTILEYKNTGDVIELKNEVIKDISNKNATERIPDFIEKFTDDILASTIQFVFKRCSEESINYDDLIKSVRKLCETLYEGSLKHSYILKSCDKYFKFTFESIDDYQYISLRNAISSRYRALQEQSAKRKHEKLKKDLDEVNSSDLSSKKLFTLFNLTEAFFYSEYVHKNSNILERMILNTMFSYLFEYEINDRYTFAKKSRLPILYSEIRILAYLRNRCFSLNYFLTEHKKYIQDVDTVDYSLLQVMEVFKVFVVSPEHIDNLILIHKYCCDTWKNGSKYLHFYTLHNQEHAVALIKSSIQLLHAISYIKIKQIDFYVLFAACYLHDISMVTLPDTSKFYTGNNEDANCIYTEFIDKLDMKNSTKTKHALYDAYQKIDAFFETNIRNQHANDSAKEIRSFKELEFLEPTMRELIARVSNGHGYDSADIYFEKSVGKSTLVNEKFIKILLRLSDLLDMSRYRISNVILNHNLANLNEVSRFHWISHLVTDGYSLETYYNINELTEQSKTGYFLKKGSILEKLVLTVDVLLSQTTEVPNTKKCSNISASDFEKINGETTGIRVICDKDGTCRNQQCNFLCKWFVFKNSYLFEELGALKHYLNSVSDNFFSVEIEVTINVVANTNIPNDVFDHLREYVIHN